MDLFTFALHCHHDHIGLMNQIQSAHIHRIRLSFLEVVFQRIAKPLGELDELSLPLFQCLLVVGTRNEPRHLIDGIKQLLNSTRNLLDGFKECFTVRDFIWNATEDLLESTGLLVQFLKGVL